MTGLSAWIALALVGCRKEEPEPVAAGALVDGLDVAVGVDVATSIGPSPHAAVARAVNELGVAVAATTQRVSVGGAEVDLAFDAYGYGELQLDAPGSAEILGGVHEAWVHAVGSTWPGFGLERAHPAFTDAQSVVAATGGWLVAGNYDVWWVTPDQAPHRVLELTTGSPITGLRAAHVDADGILDAVVWSGDTVALLRGRPGGGLSHGAVVRADGAAAGGVDAADASGDGVPDVAIAWVDQAGDHELQILEGDGAWSFTSHAPMPLQSSPVGVAIGDNDADGHAELTVLIDNGEWQRFVYSTSGFLETGPELASLIPLQTQIHSGADMNGDGGDELFFFGPIAPDTEREVIIYDLLGAQPTYLREQPPEGQVSLAHVDDDGLVDLFMLYADHELIELTWKDGNYARNLVATLSEHAPLAAGDTNGDAVVDLLLAGADWTTWTGALADVDDHTWWSAASPPVGAVTFAESGPLVTADPTGTGDVVLGFVVTDTSSSLTAWTVSPGAPPTVSVAWSVQLAPTSEEGVDLAVCGDQAWALTDSQLHLVDLSGRDVLYSVPTAGTRVDCGEGPSGAVGGVLAAGEVDLFDDNLNRIDSEAHTGAQDFAFVTFDGVPQIGTCSTAGCTAARVAYGDDGAHALATADDAGLVLTFADGRVVEPGGHGRLTVTDVDDDGHDDVIAVAEGARVYVLRSTGEGIGPAEAFHGDGAAGTGAFAIDGDGDGARDLWVQAGDGTAWFTYAPGAAPSDGGSTR